MLPPDDVDPNLPAIELRLTLTGTDRRFEVRLQGPDIEGRDEVTLDLELFRSLSPESSRFVTRAGAKDQVRSAEFLGRKLFEAIFGRRLGALLATAQSMRRGQRRPLRLRLELPAAAEQLQRLPWELLYDERLGPYGDFFVLQDVPIVRRLVREAGESPRDLLVAGGPVRVLVAGYSKVGPSTIVDVAREADVIRAGLGSGGTVTVLEQPTADELRDALRSQPWHVFHYAGTGVLAGAEALGQGFVLRSRDERGSAVLPASALSREVGTDLRLVFVNACYTDRVAAELSLTVPAAVGVLGGILDASAVVLAETVYAELGRGAPIEAAISAARRAVANRQPGTLDWSAPNLYVSATETRLVAVARTPPEERPDAQTLFVTRSEPRRRGREAKGTPLPQADLEYLEARLDVDRRNVAALEAHLTELGEEAGGELKDRIGELRERIAENERKLGGAR